MTTKANRISLCMITLNEEKVLNRCLKSVKNLVDEIIIADTGSSDSTVEIAGEFGARVFTYKWDDNFSNARNYTLGFAAGEWILVLDADEVLVCENREVLNRLTADSGAEGYFIKIVNLLGSPPDFETSEDMVLRLFRNRPSYRFSGAIHEQVYSSILSSSPEGLKAAVRTAPLTIYHDGYTNETLREKSKTNRNSAVIEKALAETPGQPFLLYSLGSELFLAGDFPKAREMFDQALSGIAETEGYFRDLLVKQYLCLLKLNLTGELHGLMDRFSDTCKTSPDLLFLSALEHLNRGSTGLAEQYIRQTLKALSDVKTGCFVVRDYQVFQVIAEVCEKRQKWTEAVHFYFRVIEAKPNYVYPLKCVISIYRKYLSGDHLVRQLGFLSPELIGGLLANLDWTSEPDVVKLLLLAFCGRLKGEQCSQALLSSVFKVIRRKTLCLSEKSVKVSANLCLAALSAAWLRPAGVNALSGSGNLLEDLTYVLLDYRVD